MYVSAGILFLLEMVGALADPDACEEGVKRARARKRQTLCHFVVAGFLVVVVLFYVGDFRFLDALGLGNRTDLSRLPVWLDHLLLAVVLLGGAEQMSAFLKMVGAPGGSTRGEGAQPVEVSGKLTLEEPAGKT
jgi:hypothetical protein